VGTGIVISSFSKILEATGKIDTKFIGVDINDKALELAKRLF
jgi:methylase of polypeptide subunit release factors